jgi:nitroimidazol reductase NimA-like FMN-containing flavoprotein (pyridoxamine 5'-phosphate oxidase superfamily)
MALSPIICCFVTLSASAPVGSVGEGGDATIRLINVLFLVASVEEKFHEPYGDLSNLTLTRASNWRVSLRKEREVPTEQGNLSLLDDPVAQELLHSTNLARLAYTWRDGTPRVVPIWFHWDGQAIVLGSPPNAPKVDVLPDNSKVALTIDRDEWPYHALLIRGTANVETVEGVTAEYVACAERYFGEEQGWEWVGRVRQRFPQMVRISVRPEWVSILDFETRFPSAIAAAMSD